MKQNLKIKKEITELGFRSQKLMFNMDIKKGLESFILGLQLFRL